MHHKQENVTDARVKCAVAASAERDGRKGPQKGDVVEM